MNVDVEGLDIEVLKSNDWVKYRPRFILVESLRSSLEDIKDNPVYGYLKQNGYLFIAKTYNTLFFENIE